MKKVVIGTVEEAIATFGVPSESSTQPEVLFEMMNPRSLLDVVRVKESKPKGKRNAKQQCKNKS